jgi:hypothetical protein
MIEEISTIINTEARAFSNVGRAGLDFWYVSHLIQQNSELTSTKGPKHQSLE